MVEPRDGRVKVKDGDCMSLDEMAKKYSEKWNVPFEEAKRKIQKFLEEGPSEKKKVPGPENIFPEPIGPLSEKIMDINQAALSTAWTRRSLLDLSQPPEELKSLKEKVSSLEQMVTSVMSMVQSEVKGLRETLEAKKAEEARQKLLQEINENVIEQLKQKIETLKKG